MKVLASISEVKVAYAEQIVAENQEIGRFLLNVLKTEVDAGDMISEFTFRERYTSDGWELIVNARDCLSSDLVRREFQGVRLVQVFEALSR